jgi:hypothetical protein
VVRVEPFGLSIGVDWTHALYVRVGNGRAPHAVMILPCLWSKSVGDIKVLQFWSLASDCLEWQRDCAGGHSLWCHHAPENGSRHCAVQSWALDVEAAEA